MNEKEEINSTPLLLPEMNDETLNLFGKTSKFPSKMKKRRV